MSHLEAGAAAPDFSVTDHQGIQRSLIDYRGAHLVLWFYPRADTPGCTTEGCGFRDIYSEFEAKGAAIVGVSFDTIEENRAFAEKFSFPYPLLCDRDRTMGLAYFATDEPGTGGYAKRIGVLIDPEGKVVEYWASASAAEFPQEVLDRIP
mgnify:FL=1